MRCPLTAPDSTAHRDGAAAPHARARDTTSTTATAIALGAVLLSAYALAISHRHDPLGYDIDTGDPPDDPDLVAEIQDEMTRVVLSHDAERRWSVGPSISRVEPHCPSGRSS